MSDDREATTAPTIVRDWMAHLGYTPEQVAEGEADRDHSACDTIDGAWFCTDEDGRSPHPVHDEMDGIAELVMFVLEHPALVEAFDAAKVVVLRSIADLIDRGPAIPLPPSVYSALVRESAGDFETRG